MLLLDKEHAGALDLSWGGCRIRGFLHLHFLSLGAAKNRPITVTDVQSDGRPLALYPEIRTTRHMYALQWLPREIRDDRPLLYNNGSTTT
eukprot:scaffold13700_cov136-Isochrysis_galbana.AAC.5